MMKRTCQRCCALSVGGGLYAFHYLCELGYKTTTSQRIAEMQPREECPKPLTNDAFIELMRTK